MTLRAAVFASGRGSNFEVLADAGSGGKGTEGAKDAQSPTPRLWDVSLLITDRPQAEAVDRARARSIPFAVVTPEGHQEGGPSTSVDRGDDQVAFADRLLASLVEHSIDVVLLAGYLRLVPPSVVRRFPNRMLNLHPALLPSFGGQGMYGRRVHQAVLDSSARVSGATVHFVDEEYDRGQILAQWPVPVLSDDTAATLASRVLEVEHALYPAAVDALARALIEGSSPQSIPARGRHFILSSNLPSFP